MVEFNHTIRQFCLSPSLLALVNPRPVIEIIQRTAALATPLVTASLDTMTSVAHHDVDLNGKRIEFGLENNL